MSRISIVVNVIGAVLILGLGIAGFKVFGKPPVVPSDNSKQDGANTPVDVMTQEARLWDAPFDITTDGEAATYRVLTVGAEVTGRILAKPETTRSGTFVPEGTLLFEIDPLNYELEINRLTARLLQAQEELNAIDVDIANTRSLKQLTEEDVRVQSGQLKRLRSLFDRGATTENEVDVAIRNELVARNAMQTQVNQLTTLEQQKKTRAAAVELVTAELARAKTDLKRCRVLAPISGRIVDDVVEEGDYVKPGDLLVHISDSERMEVKCSLQAEEVAWIWQQNTITDPTTSGPDPFAAPQVPCEVIFEFQGAETIWDGVLSRYEGTGMDRQTRMFPCRILVDEPTKTRVEDSLGGAAVSPPTLLSGMYVTVRIPVSSPTPLLQIPAEAIRPGELLWVVRDNKLHITPIRLVNVADDVALILQQGEAVNPGDRIIVSPLPSVKDGMPVQEVVR
ncbi:MAG: HlyD family efflux transporter periplasmic adaptor subunit [Planctomycetaceae bacterium]|nr:HlyD family efflux transporter periplasmic adaptor subunit [Planctomycetaceae bacterium]